MCHWCNISGDKSFIKLKRFNVLSVNASSIKTSKNEVENCSRCEKATCVSWRPLIRDARFCIFGCTSHTTSLPRSCPPSSRISFASNYQELIRPIKLDGIKVIKLYESYIVTVFSNSFIEPIQMIRLIRINFHVETFSFLSIRITGYVSRFNFISNLISYIYIRTQVLINN